jgi:hypothetical protein
LRRTVVFFLMCLAVALPLAAQNAGDFSITTFKAGEGDDTVVERAALRNWVYFRAFIAKPVNGPEAVLELDLPGEDFEAGAACTGTKPIRCTIPSNQWDFVDITVRAVMNETGVQTATARLIAPGDPNPANDQASVSLEVFDQPSTSVRTLAYSPTGRYEPGSEAKFLVEVRNYFGTDATDAVLTLTLPDGGTFTGVTPSDPAVTCVVDPGRATCTLPLLPERGLFDVAVDAKAPEQLTGGDFTLHASLRTSVADFDPEDNDASSGGALIRHILVTNTGDEGSGSLRQALLDAQQLCATEPCTVDFRIPGTPQNGRFVIRPRTELPEVRGTVTIDGATQKAFGSDANPAGPEIELDGSLTTGTTRGLVLGDGCDMNVLELAIRNFPAPGIELRRGGETPEGCSRQVPYLTTTLAHNHLTGNYRGIAVAAATTVFVTDNFIAGNRRAGVFVESAFHSGIARNLISGNGASGIFLGNTSGSVTNNRVIANGEWGIARTYGGGDVVIRQNSIHDNRHPAIDAGLDFETPNATDSWTNRPPNKPVLFSAQYDPVANKTIVRGRLDSETLGGNPVPEEFLIDVYSSRAGSAAVQAEQWVAAQVVAGHGDFTIEVDGDYRGRQISATHTRNRRIFFDDFIRNTSELSNGVIAQ